jgi:glycosyltransferase involved in cell wall biosynthesis
MKKEFTLMWAGLLIRRKALPLGLDALARVRHLPVRLLVVGGGPLKQQWQKQAADLGLANRVDFLGHIHWTEMAEQYRKADAFLFTSLRDSSGNVVFEAMANALPILTLDHQGVGTFVPPEAGIKVPVTTPAETVTGLAEGIERLVTRPDERLRMGEAAWAFVKANNWEHRAELMSGYYEKLVRDR